jgi:hypothetical protein
MTSDKMIQLLKDLDKVYREVRATRIKFRELESKLLRLIESLENL